MAALLVAMTGCQKEPQVETPGNDVDAKHYVAVNISLPSTTGTRANGNFDDGEANEYKVQNITLAFFNDGSYVNSIPVDSNPWEETLNDDNITATKGTGAIEIDFANFNQVLVILNNSIDVSTKKFDPSQGIHTANTTEITDIKTINGASNDSFLMTNAPQYDEKQHSFTYLVAITPQTSVEAALTNAPTVQVERATAKVEVKTNTKVEMKDQYSVGEDESTVAFKNWNLDITNKTFYPVRLCQGYTSGADWWKDTDNLINPGIYSNPRTYFAVDPNYESLGEAAKSSFNAITVVDGEWEKPQYCLENTFNINGMNQNQSTRVVLKAEFIPGTIKKADEENWPTEGEGGKTWYKVGAANYAYTKAALLELLNEEKLPTFTNGVYTHSNYGKIYEYTDAICYYPIIIRHFNLKELGYETLTEAEYLTKFDENNGYFAQDLGRYSVVRNNWYRLTINSVSQPGEPVIPEPGTGTDDEVKRYVACDIEILSWCTRDQGVDL